MIDVYVANVFDAVDIFGLIQSIKFIIDGHEFVEYLIRFLHSKLNKACLQNVMSLETVSMNA